MKYTGSTKKIWIFAYVICLTLFIYLFQNPKNMGFGWTYPYFSGAANMSNLVEWKISVSQYESLRHLPMSDIRLLDFSTDSCTKLFRGNNIGYVWIIWLSNKLFTQMGDMNATILLQVLIFISITCIVNFTCFSHLTSRIVFSILFGFNPIVVHFVTFPFYYFWQILPGVVAIFALYKYSTSPKFALSVIPILLASLFIRPSLVFTIIAIPIIYLLVNKTKPAWIVSFLSLFILTAGIFIMKKINPIGSGPFHIMYVGLRSFDSDMGKANLSDSISWNEVERRVGFKYSFNPIDGNCSNTDSMDLYNNTLKKSYREKLRRYPFVLVRNAFFNILASFSPFGGYIVSNPILTGLNIFFGVLVLCYLIYFRETIGLVLLIANSMSYAWYFPPIPAYNFYAYLVIAFVIAKHIHRFGSMLSDVLKITLKAPKNF